MYTVDIIESLASCKLLLIPWSHCWGICNHLMHSLVHVVPLLERQRIICSHCCLAGQLAVIRVYVLNSWYILKAALLYVDCAGWDEDSHLIRRCLLLACSVWEWTNWGLPKSGSRGVLEWWWYRGDSGTGSGKASLLWPVCICFMQQVIPSGTVTLKWNLPKASKEGHLCISKYTSKIAVMTCHLCLVQHLCMGRHLWKKWCKSVSGIYAVNKIGELCGETSGKVLHGRSQQDGHCICRHNACVWLYESEDYVPYAVKILR